MKKTEFECIIDCETAVVELERTECLLSLLFEEIDEALSASLSKETWKAQYCCNRASFSEAIATAISQNISNVKDILNTFLEEKQ